MNAAQIHLLINHLPVLVPVIGASLSGVGIILKSRDIRAAGVWLLVIGALSAIPTYLTGEPAENVLKNFPGASRLLIEDHESSALVSLIMIELAGAWGLLVIYGLRARKPFVERRLTWAILGLLSTISFGFVARTAHLGGLIRHEEIRTRDRF